MFCHSAFETSSGFSILLRPRNIGSDTALAVEKQSSGLFLASLRAAMPRRFGVKVVVSGDRGIL